MAPSSHRVRSVVVVAALGCLLSGCERAQEPGQYAFTAEEIIRDDCALLADADALWDGRLHVSGNVVWMEYALYGMELRGQYKHDVEGFVLDGSAANVTESVGGQECRFDYANVHLEGETRSATAFGGTVRVEYLPAPGNLCECSVWARFVANLEG